MKTLKFHVIIATALAVLCLGSSVAVNAVDRCPEWTEETCVEDPDPCATEECGATYENKVYVEDRWDCVWYPKDCDCSCSSTGQYEDC